MLIAHAPAGYLVSRFIIRTFFRKRVRNDRSDKKYIFLMLAGLVGAILPDLDFIYHIFVDSDKTPHHSYWTHMPVFWLAIWLMLVLVGRWKNRWFFTASTSVLCVNALIHLVLDTITGVIYWFYPLSEKGINIFKVSNTHIWWVHNFTGHWTFLIEIAIIAIALIIFMRVGETWNYIVHLYRESEKLRIVTVRLGVMALGVLAVVTVGSLKFSIDNRIIKKVFRLKQYVSQAFRPS
jgi:inner membrane protein